MFSGSKSINLVPDHVASFSYSQEKTKKILDIWVKSNTFPSAVLARLHKLVKGTAEKGAYHISLVFAKYFFHSRNSKHVLGKRFET